ncbi:hypothetical protein DRO33_00115 [Candidatus Bathyarchaeota archaeon]|nr:MAG: hypothetical protein DRO33_00115 [Candidatus Bathyarchaeota archaeon]
MGGEAEKRRGCLASYSPFFGVGAFAFLELPESWDLRVAPEPPECDLLGDWNPAGEFRWIVRGKLKAFLVNEGGGRAYLLSVEVKDFRRASEAERALRKKLRKLEGDRASEVIEQGRMDISGHEASYLVLARRRRSFLGRREARYMVVAGFFCDRTGRMVWLEVVGGPYLMEDVADLVSIISSLSCHE